MNTTLSSWQWAGIIVIALDLLVLLVTSRIAIKCNIYTGLLAASPRKREKVSAWFEKRGGYRPEVHSGSVTVTTLSLILLLAMLVLMAPRG